MADATIHHATLTPTSDLLSIGHVCHTLQRGYREVFAAAAHLEIEPPFAIDGVIYFSNAQAEQIRQFLAEHRVHDLSADTPPMEPDAETRREAQREPLDLLDEIEQTDDATKRSDLTFALAVSCGQRAGEDAQAARHELLPVLVRIANSDDDAIDEARRWLTANLLVKDYE